MELDFLTRSQYKEITMAETLVKQVQFLKENGFTEQQANAMIYFQRDNVENVMATKRDIADVRKDIEQLRADTMKDIALLKKDLTLKLGSIMTAGIILLGLLIKL